MKIVQKIISFERKSWFYNANTCLGQAKRKTKQRTFTRGFNASNINFGYFLLFTKLLMKMKREVLTELFILPLYPHFAGATTLKQANRRVILYTISWYILFFWKKKIQRKTGPNKFPTCSTRFRKVPKTPVLDPGKNSSYFVFLISQQFKWCSNGKIYAMELEKIKLLTKFQSVGFNLMRWKWFERYLGHLHACLLTAIILKLKIMSYCH